jgi:site-specific DNA-cytosine methylase
LAEDTWYIVAEYRWRIVAEDSWYILGECYWYIIGCSVTNIEEIPNHVQHPGARIYIGHIGSFYDYPAKALKAGTHGTPGGENILKIPGGDLVRYFTTREAARLQTFPDDYRFHGTWGACIKQLGNAVPVEVIRLFAAKIQESLIKRIGN